MKVWRDELADALLLHIARSNLSCFSIPEEKKRNLLFGCQVSLVGETSDRLFAMQNLTIFQKVAGYNIHKLYRP